VPDYRRVRLCCTLRWTLLQEITPVNDSTLDLGPSTWAVVLAGGDGRRLQTLTHDADGIPVPKQFCSLQGGPCLLEDALQRAFAIAPFRHLCAVVAAQHRRWWDGLAGNLPKQNLIVQPHNRGTAHGVLLPLLHILARDPDAHVVLLPADHYVGDEGTLAIALRRAAALARANDRSVYLLGIEPEEPDTELGYILPSPRRFRDSPSQVLQFVEKPNSARASALIDQGALWNAFIIAGSVRALLRLFDDSFSSIIVSFSHMAEGRIELEDALFDQLYARLPSVDFSHGVLQGREKMLQVLRVPRCGWTDLGTPQRIGMTLQRLRENSDAPRRQTRAFHLNLAEQYARGIPSAARMPS
jgi:mannose-1-phosphate guanylyltransferase